MPSVGCPVPRKDAYDKLLGVSKYIDDYNFDNQVYVYTVRSNQAYGKLLGVDKTEAEKMPGVLGVVTYDQIPGTNTIPLVKLDEPYLAEGYVHFHGEPVALVVAETYEQAEEAAKLVKLNIEPLTPSLTIEDSLKPDAPKIFGEDNICSYFNVEHGNAEEAFKSDSRITHVFEKEYRTPYQEHAYLETNGCIAVPGIEDSITVYGSMQCPHYVQDAVAMAAGVDKNKVRIIQTTTGGGFGGKEDFPSVVCGQATIVAKIFKRPAKLIYKRDEDIMASSKRHPGKVIMKVGTDDNGKLIAATIKYYMDAGGYTTLTPLVLLRGAVHALGPYKCDHVHIQAYGVCTNKVPCGAYRGFGSPQTVFATETMMDEISEALNINPLEFRIRNGFRIGDTTATGQVIEESCGLQETLDKASKKCNWEYKWQKPSEKKGNIRKGIGLASVFYGVGLGAGGKAIDRSASSIMLLQDGSVRVAVGNVEMGQGARTVLAQIAADALGAPYDLVNVIETDTAIIPDSGPTVASRTTFMSGNSIMIAAKEMKPRLLEAAGLLLGVPAEKVELIDGQAWVKGETDSKKVPFTEIVKKLYAERLQPISYGWFKAPNTNRNPETGQGQAYYVYSYCTNIAEVEVDMETGTYNVTKITSAHDMGRAINPQQVEGQIEGGTMQGFGYGTTEEIQHSPDGRMLNNSFSTYILPTTIDAPEVDPIIIEHRYSEGPYGAKGFGEVPLMCVAPAVANAIYNATGVRIRNLPCKPEKILGLDK